MQVHIPIAVIVFGLPGSGKSYFAEKLARRINGEYINSDRLRKELFPRRTYSDAEKKAVYRAMFQKMNSPTGEIKNIVLDATFHKDNLRQLFLKKSGKKLKMFFIEIVADENLIRKRLKKERLYSEADFEVYKLIQKQWEPMYEPHLTLDSTDDNLDFMIKTAVDYLSTQNDTRTD